MSSTVKKINKLLEDSPNFGLVKPSAMNADKPENIHIVKGKCNDGKFYIKRAAGAECGRELNNSVKASELIKGCLTKKELRIKVAEMQNGKDDICGGCVATLYAKDKV